MKGGSEIVDTLVANTTITLKKSTKLPRNDLNIAKDRLQLSNGNNTLHNIKGVGFTVSKNL